jgi:hypothetical protein
MNFTQWFDLIGFAIAAILIGWALDSIMEGEEPRTMPDR